MNLEKIENKLDQYNADDYFVEMSDLEDICANEVGCWKTRYDAENKKENPNKQTKEKCNRTLKVRITKLKVPIVGELELYID